MKHFLILIAICSWARVSSAAVSAELHARNSDNSSLYRLPKDVDPESYDILLLTGVTTGDFKYTGEVNITLGVKEKTRRVVVHSEGLRMVSAKTLLRRTSQKDDAPTLLISDQTYDRETQLYSIHFLEDLSPGKYILSLYFEGEVLDDIFGFYRSSYVTNNETRWIGVTQFSPTFARRAFPCMDEPGFKATFQLHIGHFGNETVTSNTDQQSREITNRGDYFITTFQQTPRMSTYLLGWAVHDFCRVNTSDPRFSLWTRFDSSNLPQPLIESPLLVEGPKIYSALLDWMALENPLNKVEQFAVPDFNFQAMENWGFVTYRESLPLSFYETTPLQTIHSGLETIAHEYTHTWFGNLVTPEFWSYAWLKEGFATYFAHYVIGLVHQDWHKMDLFAVNVVQKSLVSDSVNHTRTMNGKNVGSPESCKAALDFVTYDKGSSIIRMFANVMGEEAFQKAMRSYLKQNQYEAATPSILYKHLDLALKSTPPSNKFPVPIGEMIESWASQSNFPLIRASCLRQNLLQVSQEPFQFRRGNTTLQTDSRFWWVPLQVLSASQTEGKPTAESLIWLGPEKSKTIKLPTTKKAQWFLLNPQQVGYYRVDYDVDNWKALSKLLGSSEYVMLSPVSRAVLIDDAFNLARGGYRNYELPLNLIQYLIQEDDYEPWLAANRAITLLNNNFKNRPNVRDAFKRYVIRLISPIYQRLGFREDPLDSDIKKMHRNLVLSTACSLDLVQCVSNAKSIFDNWIADKNKTMPPNLKNFVYRVGILKGTDTDWIQLWDIFLKTNLYSEKELLFGALGCTNNNTFINKYLEYSIQDTSNIAKQYRLTIIRSVVSRSHKHFDLTLNYVEENIHKIIELRGIKFLKDILSAIGKEITTKKEVKKFERFIDRKSKELGSAFQTGVKVVDSAKNNIKWIDECSAEVEAFLNNSTTSH